MFPFRGMSFLSSSRSNRANPTSSCLRNAVALFHVIEKELEWRRARGQLEGFDTMAYSKPIIAVGPDHPLEDDTLAADYFRSYSFLTYT